MNKETELKAAAAQAYCPENGPAGYSAFPGDRQQKADNSCATKTGQLEKLPTRIVRDVNIWQLLRAKKLHRRSGNICNLHYQQDRALSAVATDATDAKIQLDKSNAEVGGCADLEHT